jgi:hypothetical protein
MTGQLLLTITGRAGLTWEQLVNAAEVLPPERGAVERRDDLPAACVT